MTAPPDSSERDFDNTVALYSRKNKPSVLLTHLSTRNIRGTTCFLRTVYVINIGETQEKTGRSSQSLPSGLR